MSFDLDLIAERAGAYAEHVTLERGRYGVVTTRRYCRSCAKAASRDQKAFVRGWRVGTFELVFGQQHEAAA